MFSEKYGYKSEKQIQHECISDTLRRRIWNLFYQSEIKNGGLSSARINQAFTGEPAIEEIVCDKLGFIVNGSVKGLNAQGKIEYYLTKNCQWFEVYDFVDIHLSALSSDKRKTRSAQYNKLFEEEKSGYRIVNGSVEPITNGQEIEVVEAASNSPFCSVNEHLQKALNFYGDRKNPDYENSIKESICAVEAMCCIITGMSGAQATLGNALKKLEETGVHIHGAMKSAFSSLYGYTSDENGIRHGGIDFTNAPAEDAKYMLISCSAFVNYLIEKWSKVNEGKEEKDGK